MSRVTAALMLALSAVLAFTVLPIFAGFALVRERNRIDRLDANRLSVRVLRLLALLALSLIALAGTAHATDVTLSWTLPTANTDGSAPASVSGYNIYVASTDAALSALPNTAAGGAPAVDGRTLGTPSVLSYTFANVPPGTYFYAVTAWFCLPNGGACIESDQSVHVSKTVPVVLKKPLPPASLRAQ